MKDEVKRGVRGWGLGYGLEEYNPNNLCQSVAQKYMLRGIRAIRG